jgi:MSHA biogenesis protein MshP
MTPAHVTRPPLRQRQHGVSIIAAIFLLLLFAALAAFMVSLTSTANITSAQDVQGVRAYQAAQAGVEWGLFQLDPNDNAKIDPPPITLNCPASTPLPNIPGFSVVVTCTSYGPYDEGSSKVMVFRIVATASVPGAAAPPAAAEREAEARVAKCQYSGVPKLSNC